jgi:hypothetical protein
MLAGGFLQCVAFAYRDQSVRAAWGAQIAFGQVAGIEDHRPDRGPILNLPAGVQRRQALIGGPEHRRELLDITGLVGDLGGHDELVIADDQLGVLALNPTLGRGHRP